MLNTKIKNIAGIIEDSLGLSLKEKKFEEYSKNLREAAITLGFEGIESFSEKVAASGNKLSSEEKRVLAAYLTVSETYFFREKPAMSMFISTILPQLIKNKREDKIRIWSAGCSSGEEPYTIAIIINEHFPQLRKNDFEIIATDINPNVITKARNGLYTPWSFREIPDLYTKKYFTKEGDNFRISDKIKECVKFDILNLVSDIYPGESDVCQKLDTIFCRNVLMYLNHNHIKNISKRFHKILKDDGWFITSQVELNDELFGLFAKSYSEDGIFYRKSELINKKHNETISKRIQETTSNKIPLEKHKKRQIRDVKEESTSLTTVSQELGLLFNESKYIECIKIALTEIEKGNEDLTILNILAKSYANSGQYKLAADVLDKIISQNPASDDTYYLYGTILAENNEIAKAKTMFKKDLYINPDNLLSHLMLGNILKDEGNTKAAMIHYRNAMDITDKIKEEEVEKVSHGMNIKRLREFISKFIDNNR
ncbi:protein-glutamate O-methyltransferase CheR [Bacteroidales bacterium]